MLQSGAPVQPCSVSMLVKKKYLTAISACSIVSKVTRMEKFVQQTFLYDFYGELLTEHQRQVYEQVVFEDLSPSEAAQNQSISRQGVHDLIKRCNRILEEYESRLHQVEKFLKIRDNVRRIQQLTDRENGDSVEERMREIRRISSDILEEL